MGSQVDFNTFCYKKRTSILKRINGGRSESSSEQSSLEKDSARAANCEDSSCPSGRRNFHVEGVESNGVADELVSSEESCEESDGRSESLECGVSDNVNAGNLKKLAEMFPNESRTRLEQVLDSTSSLKNAVETICTFQKCDEGRLISGRYNYSIPLMYQSSSDLLGEEAKASTRPASQGNTNW